MTLPVMKDWPFFRSIAQFASQVESLIDRVTTVSLILFSTTEHGEEPFVFTEHVVHPCDHVLRWPMHRAGSKKEIRRDSFLNEIKDVDFDRLSLEFYKDHVQRYHRCTFNGELIFLMFQRKRNAPFRVEDVKKGLLCLKAKIQEEYSLCETTTVRLLRAFFITSHLPQYALDHGYQVCHEVLKTQVDPITAQPKGKICGEVLEFATEDRKRDFILDHFPSSALEILKDPSGDVYFKITYQLPLVSLKSSLEEMRIPSHTARMSYDSRERKAEMFLFPINYDAYCPEEAPVMVPRIKA